MAATASAAARPAAKPRGRARSAAGRRQSAGWRIATYVCLFFFVVWTAIPLYWMIFASFKTNKEIYDTQTFFPNAMYLGHYQQLIWGPFLGWVRNSAVVASFTTVLSVIVGALGGYAIARLTFRGRSLIARSLILAYLVPSSLLFIPMFTIVSTLDLANKIQSLMLVYLSFTVPFCTWLLVGYFKSMPAELEEAALIDGCTRFGALRRVTLPISLPAVAVVALFSFTLSWNEFLYALVFINNTSSRTAIVGIQTMLGQDVFFWGQMMAGAVITSIPPVIIYILAQRWVVRGLAVGAVKG